MYDSERDGRSRDLGYRPGCVGVRNDFPRANHLTNHIGRQHQASKDVGAGTE